MKSIADGVAQGAEWKDSLAEDLTFIKEHKRYRISKRTMPSVLLFVSFLVSTAYMLRTSLMISYKGHVALSIGLVLLLLLLAVSHIVRYMRSLRFQTIGTPFVMNENVKILASFLKAQGVNVYHHPKKKEVVQILSRPLGNNPNQREVMVFIADDNRILVNSHFAGMKWGMASSSSNAGRMAKKLAEWVALNYEAGSTIAKEKIEQ